MIRSPALVLILIPLVSCNVSSLTDSYTNAPSSYKCSYEGTKHVVQDLFKLEVEEELCVPVCGETNSLGDLFDIALHNSPSTKSSWESAKAAAAEYGENLSPYLPTIGFDAEFNANREGYVFNNANGPDTFLMNEQIQYGPIMALSYLLFDGGERKAKAHKYFWLLQESNYLHNEKIQSVMQTVANAYYTHLSDKALLEANIEDLENAEEAYKAASDKYKAGIFSITDMLQAKTNYLQKKVTLTDQKNTTENSYVNLVTNLGLPPNSPDIDLQDFPTHLGACPFSNNLEDLINIAKTARGEFLAAKASVLSAKADLKMAESEVMPQLNITATAGEFWYQNNFRDQGNYNIYLDLKFPVFSAFYYRNLIKNKKALLAEAQASLYQTELSIIEEVKTAMNDLMAAKEKICDTKDYLEAARIENDAMFKKYKLGIVSILDLLQAQAFLADAKAQYISAQKDYYSSIINVSFATGMLSTQSKEIGYEK